MTPLALDPTNTAARAAAWPRATDSERLLDVDVASLRFRSVRISQLAALFEPGDLLVVNDAATLPASLFAEAPGGARVEVRLLGERIAGSFDALLFGPGDWRTPTERRPPPPRLAVGATLRFATELSAQVVTVDPEAPRFVELSFVGDRSSFWPALYRHGRPIQYAHVAGPLELWHVQTRFAARPWASELPSAGRPLSWEALLALRRRGVGLVSLTHAAGLSSTGSSELDRRLPRAERYDIPPTTSAAIARTRAAGGCVIAVGTTVVRALEASAAAPGPGVAELVIGRGFRPRVVDGVLTGVHEPGTSHFALLEAFAPRSLLERAYRYSLEQGYLHHEFGDSWLVS
jgi:S-adenosylmethionine:tRNA ribosyltransferase-isomerase